MMIPGNMQRDNRFMSTDVQIRENYYHEMVLLQAGYIRQLENALEQIGTMTLPSQIEMAVYIAKSSISPWHNDWLNNQEKP